MNEVECKSDEFFDNANSLFFYIFKNLIFVVVVVTVVVWAPLAAFQLFKSLDLNQLTSISVG